jgi:hypothetical protein
MSHYNTIMVRFIRDDKKPALDDKVVIQKSTVTGTFLLSFKSSFNQARRGSMKIVTAISETAVFAWLRIVMRLLEHDKDKFEYIQVDFPLMPSILLRVSSHMNDIYFSLRDALEFHITNWDSTEDVSRSHGRFQYVPEPEHDSASMYDDMPPLIPIRTEASPLPPTPPPTRSSPLPPPPSPRKERGTHHLFLDHNEDDGTGCTGLGFANDDED